MTGLQDGKKSVEIKGILELLPLRHPFVLVDRVLEVHLGHSIRALKNVTYNEPFFRGHFPSRPLMPGVIVIEALAQAAGILWLASVDPLARGTAQLHFVGLDKARFRKPVLPGDQLLLSARVGPTLKTMLRFSTAAFVGKDEVASAEVMMVAQTLDDQRDAQSPATVGVSGQ